MLRLLCHTTRRYFINHQQILKAFLVSLPELRKLPFFGQVEYFDPKRCIYINDTLDFLARSGGNKCTYFEWPKQEDIKKMTPKDLGKDKKVENLQVKSITVRTDEINFLTGIKVELQNGFCSPDFRATDHGNTQPKPITHMAGEDDISSVSVKVHKDSNGYQFYEGLVLHSE